MGTPALTACKEGSQLSLLQHTTSPETWPRLLRLPPLPPRSPLSRRPLRLRLRLLRRRPLRLPRQLTVTQRRPPMARPKRSPTVRLQLPPTVKQRLLPTERPRRRLPTEALRQLTVPPKPTLLKQARQPRGRPTPLQRMLAPRRSLS